MLGKPSKPHKDQKTRRPGEKESRTKGCVAPVTSNGAAMLKPGASPTPHRGKPCFTIFDLQYCSDWKTICTCEDTSTQSSPSAAPGQMVLRQRARQPQTTSQAGSHIVLMFGLTCILSDPFLEKSWQWRSHGSELFRGTCCDMLPHKIKHGYCGSLMTPCHSCFDICFLLRACI